MANAIIVLILLIIAFFALNSAKKHLKCGCCGGCSEIKIKPKDKNKSHYTHKVVVYIDGMTCEHCKSTIENAFNSLPDCYATVNLKKKYAEILSKTILEDEKISEIVTKKGYEIIKFVRG